MALTGSFFWSLIIKTLLWNSLFCFAELSGLRTTGSAVTDSLRSCCTFSSIFLYYSGLRTKRETITGILPSNCPFSSSCLRRHSTESENELISRYPCRCDDVCTDLQDCCHDAKMNKMAKQVISSCKEFPTTAGNKFPLMVISTCPANTDSQLEKKCSMKSYNSNSDYLMDVLVVSKGKVYANVYCAKCNSAEGVQPTKVKCSEPINSPKELAKMTYHPGDLVWSDEGRDDIQCFIDITEPNGIFRSCEVNIEDGCPNHWKNSKTRERCNSYTYYVTYLDSVYRNWDCAICNGASPDKISCLPDRAPGLERAILYSLMDLFEGKGCDIWDPINEVCMDPPTNKAVDILSVILVSISLICMFLHMLIFVALPKRQNIPSKNLLCLTISLFIAEFFFICCFTAVGNYTACIIYSTVMYYFFMSSFMWMNIMSVDICRTFHSRGNYAFHRNISNKPFVYYSLFAWGIPFLMALVAILVDQFSDGSSTLSPNFGLGRCWFNGTAALLFYFTAPSLIIVVVNFVLFGLSVYDIYHQQQSGEMARSTVMSSKNTLKERPSKLIVISTDSKKPDSVENSSDRNKFARNDAARGSKLSNQIKLKMQNSLLLSTKQRVQLVLYFKLALIMGLTWVFGFIGSITDSLFCTYMFVILNGLQGMLIFVSFDCKRKKWDELRGRAQERGLSISPRRSSATTTTSLSSGTKSKRSSANSARSSATIVQPLAGVISSDANRLTNETIQEESDQ